MFNKSSVEKIMFVDIYQIARHIESFFSDFLIAKPENVKSPIIGLAIAQKFINVVIAENSEWVTEQQPKTEVLFSEFIESGNWNKEDICIQIYNLLNDFHFSLMCFLGTNKWVYHKVSAGKTAFELVIEKYGDFRALAWIDLQFEYQQYDIAIANARAEGEDIEELLVSKDRTIRALLKLL